ncbi:MAG: hypothetical protein WBP64_04875 [Nitrososphaeraceae archaeon]
MAYSRVKCLPTVKRIPDELWDEIRLILPSEKPNNTIGRPAVSFRAHIILSIAAQINLLIRTIDTIVLC